MVRMASPERGIRVAPEELKYSSSLNLRALPCPFRSLFDRLTRLDTLNRLLITVAVGHLHQRCQLRREVRMHRIQTVPPGPVPPPGRRRIARGPTAQMPQ